MLTLTESLAREVAARKKRNTRDRLARDYIKNHPEIKESPNMDIKKGDIPKGTTEATIRGIARHYNKQKLIRDIIRETKKDNSSGTEKKTES